jgi:hypothetical protein
MRAYYRGYQRAGLARVHVVRETRKKTYRSTFGGGSGLDESWCGQGAGPHQKSQIVEVDPDKPLEPGLAWCWKCVAGQADHLGLTSKIVALVVAMEAALRATADKQPEGQAD